MLESILLLDVVVTPKNHIRVLFSKFVQPSRTSVKLGIHLYDFSLGLSKELSKEEFNVKSDASEEKS